MINWEEGVERSKLLYPRSASLGPIFVVWIVIVFLIFFSTKTLQIYIFSDGEGSTRSSTRRKPSNKDETEGFMNVE